MASVSDFEAAVPSRRAVTKAGLRRAADDVMRLSGLVILAVGIARAINPSRSSEQLRMSSAERRFAAARSELERL